MAKKDPARPYWQVCHEYDASLKEYRNAASMLYESVRAAMSVCKSPEGAFKALQMINERAEDFRKAAYGDD